MTDNYGQIAKQPGWMVTLLAPDNSAMQEAVNSLGFDSMEAAAQDGGARSTLANLVKYHILPPVEWTRATWTTPFMRRGEQMPTALEGHSIAAEALEDGKVKLMSPKTTAYLYSKDRYACKGHVNIINKVLEPW